MSVINQALRDLEKRGATPLLESPRDKAEPVYHNESTEVASANRVRVAMWCFGSVCASLVASYAYYSHTDTALESGVVSAVELVDKQYIASEHSPDTQVPAVSVIEQSKVIKADTKNSELDIKSVIRNEQVAASQLANVVAIDQSSPMQEEVSKPLDSLNAVQKSDSASVEQLSSSPEVLAHPKVVKPAASPEPVSRESVSREPVKTPVAAPAPVRVSPKSLDLKTALNARRKFEAGELLVAKQLLQSFVGNNDVNQASTLELANVLFKLKHFDELDALLESKDALDQPRMRMIAGRRQLQQRNYDAAYEVLRSPLPSIERHPHYYALLASIEQKRGRYEQQIDIYHRLLNAHGDHAKWWLGTAIAWDKLKKYEHARKAYVRTQQLNLSDANLVAFVDQRLKQLRGH